MMNESQTDLFSQFDQEKADQKANEQLDKELNDEFAPLASRMRPKTLEEYVGQSHLLGEGRPLRTILNKGQCYSQTSHRSESLFKGANHFRVNSLHSKNSSNRRRRSPFSSV